MYNTGHSLTVIGFEIRKAGSVNLLVFDPMFKTSPAIERMIDATGSQPSKINVATATTANPARLLKAYRRGQSYLQKYREFELLK